MQSATRRRRAAERPQPSTTPEDNLIAVARWVAWGVLAATPLGLLPGIFISHDVMPKVITVMTGAAVLLFLLPRWSDGIRQLGTVPQGRWFLCLVAAQIAVLILSTVFSVQPMLSLVGTTWRRFGLAEQLAALVIALAAAALAKGSPRSTTALWRAVSVCAALASFYGIAQYFGVDPFLENRLYSIDYLGGIVRPPATMGHAIYFASWLAVVTPISAWRAAEEQPGCWRALHATATILATVAILVSGSRGALLGLAAAGAVLLVHRRPSRNLLAAGLAAALLCGLFVAFAPAGANLRHRIEQWRGDPGSVRLGVWKDCPKLLEKSPLIGSGPETFAGVFRKIESAELARAYPDFINETPHNAFLDAACEEGLAGFMILAGVCIAGLRAKKPAFRAAILSAIVCGVFASFSIVMAVLLWAIVGISASEGLENSKAPASASAKTPTLGMIVSPVAVSFLILVVMLGVQDAAYAELGRAVEKNQADRAKNALRTATSFGIGLPGYELYASQEISKLKAWPEAEMAAALAEERGEDRASAAYQQSILRIVAGDAPGAQAKADDAIRLAPNWYKPHLLKAQIFQATGENQEAADQAHLSQFLGWKAR